MMEEMKEENEERVTIYREGGLTIFT